MVRVAGSQHMVQARLASMVDTIAAWIFARPTPIEVLEQRCNFLPARFRWSGRLWRVRRVIDVWDEAATALLPPRRYFRVQCNDGDNRVVFQDLRLGMWYMSL